LIRDRDLAVSLLPEISDSACEIWFEICQSLV